MRPKCSQCERSGKESCVYTRVSPAVTDASRRRKRNLWLQRSIEQLLQSGNLSRQSSVRSSTVPQELRSAHPTSVANGDTNTNDAVRRRHSATSVLEARLASRATAVAFNGSNHDNAPQSGQLEDALLNFNKDALNFNNCTKVATTLPQSVTTSFITSLDQNTSERAPGSLQAALGCIGPPTEHNDIPLLLGSVASSQPRSLRSDTPMLDLNHKTRTSCPNLWDMPASTLLEAWEDIFGLDDLSSPNALGLFLMDQSSIGDGSSATTAASTSSSVFSGISGSDSNNMTFQTAEVEAQGTRPSPEAVLLRSSFERAHTRDVALTLTAPGHRLNH